MPASAEIVNFKKTLHYLADRFGEMGTALSEAPDRETFPVQLEQLNLLKMGVDAALGRVDSSAQASWEYRKTFDWKFAEFAADYDKTFHHLTPKISLLERNWKIAVLKDAGDPTARMESWIGAMRVMPQSFKLPFDHLASELLMGEYVFNAVADRATDSLEDFVVAKEYADANLRWVTRMKGTVEGLEDGPVKTMLLFYIEVLDNWEKIYAGYLSLLSK